MTRFIKKEKKEIGLAPDDIFFRGDKRTQNVLLRVVDFDSKNQEEITIGSLEDVIHYQKKESVTWFNIDGLHDEVLMKQISQQFNFDNLIIADVLNTSNRPKVYEHDNCIYLNIKMLREDDETSLIAVENLSLILTGSMLISFQEIKGDVFEPIRNRIKNPKKRIRNSGTDYLLFALLDIVIDNYIYVISKLGEKIEDLEDELLRKPSQNVIKQINNYKRELNFLRKNINPAKEMILALTKMESQFIDNKNDVHFKELSSNINQAIETSDSYREILSDQLNIYHTSISTKLNDIMKFLTVFSVIFIPLTFIAGIYGTNFDYVPELHYKYSYHIMWLVMIVITVLMLFYFKKKKWL